MSRRQKETFATIRTEGAILPADLLRRIADGDKGLKGLDPEDYHLSKGEKLSEAVNRSWSRLLGSWKAFRAAADALPEADTGTTATRERWLLPLFQELGYGRLLGSRAQEAGGKSYPISHLWHRSPIHLVGFRVDLDRRTAGVAGAARTSPHGLVQEFLNRSEEYLWGFASNGFKLRILRDNASLTRQAYVEFDLETLMDGEAFADFALLWVLCHQSRVEAEKSEECWLEKWSKAAQDEGARALDQLRVGVEKAITALGQGFLALPANSALRDALRSGVLDKQDYYRELLRLVYRLIFLFVAEDRDLLLDPESAVSARERFLRFYSTRRLRDLAGRQRGSRHADLYEGVRVVASKLGDPGGCPSLGLKPLGSFLWSEAATAHLGGQVANVYFLEALRALAYRLADGSLRPVDYKNLRSEELGSVYEALLELHPEVNVDAATFALKTLGGHERKTSGSYYTADCLVQTNLDTALEPVIRARLDEAARAAKGKPEDVYRALAEKALLALKVCDPAVGSGHFLIAAGHRIAKHLAAVRTGDEEPAPEAYRQALRDVIGHCLYGVDINPMAVELCKVALWMEAMVPGKPLSFLDHRIRCGNSLLGATPELLSKGIPDGAFDPIEGDDKTVCAELRKRNRKERAGQETLGLAAEASGLYAVLSDRMSRLDAMDDSELQALRQKEETYARLQRSEEAKRAHFEADAWCAAFVGRKVKDGPEPLTEDGFRRLRRSPGARPDSLGVEVHRLTKQYRFFHWHLEFPEVFPVDGASGFDVVLGNPPWERVKLQEKEWFASRRPDIADAANAAVRKRMIDALNQADPTLFSAWGDALRQADGESSLVRSSGRYPLCGRGDINTYSIFAELCRSLKAPTGRVGIVVPTGVATDDTTKFFFQDLVKSGDLRSLYDFQSGPGLFGEVGHARFKFCLLTLGQPQQEEDASCEFAFFLRDIDHLRDPDRRFRLSPADIANVNPNTGTCPVFRTRRDAEITKGVYRRLPVLIREGEEGGNPWGVSFKRMLDMANDSGLFRTREQLEADGWELQGNVYSREGSRMLPLYEAKMVHHFDHRYGDYRDKRAESESTALPDVPSERLKDPSYVPLPRYWVDEAEVERRLEGRWDRGWLLGWRDICRSTDVRTVIAGVVPRIAVGHTTPLFMPSSEHLPRVGGMAANLVAFAFDYIARQKVGGTHVTYGLLNQLPVVPPETYDAAPSWAPAASLSAFVTPRVLELVYTAWDNQPFAQDLGYDGPPFRWDDDRRFVLRCDLDAAFFHLYGIPRDDVDYIMDTFSIVKRKDEQEHGEYRTKRQILDIFDRMQRAIDTGAPYQTLLDPPPADPRVAHTLESPEWLQDRPRAKAAPTGAVAVPQPSAGPLFDYQPRPKASELDRASDGAWARLPGLSEENAARFAVVAVLRLLGDRVSRDDVLLAHLLVRRPALAVPLMDEAIRVQWQRAVGKEAMALPANVVRLADQRELHQDRAWADVVHQLEGSRGVVTDRATGKWIVSQEHLKGNLPEWVTGRASVAVSLLEKINRPESWGKIVAFCQEVEHGRATRAVS